jgi:hypothetical protein
MIVFIARAKSMPKSFSLSRTAYKLAILTLILVWTPIAEAQSLTSRLKDGVGLACEKEGNTNRKVYRSFFKISKDRKVVATLDYRDDQPTLTAHHAATVLPEFIEWENFSLNRKTLTLTNLSISPRKQECVVVTFDELIERAKAHLIELQEGNKI